MNITERIVGYFRQIETLFKFDGLHDSDTLPAFIGSVQAGQGNQTVKTKRPVVGNDFFTEEFGIAIQNLTDSGRIHGDRNLFINSEFPFIRSYKRGFYQLFSFGLHIAAAVSGVVINKAFVCFEDGGDNHICSQYEFSGS